MQNKAKLTEDMNDKEKPNKTLAFKGRPQMPSTLSEISEEDSNKSDLHVSMGRN